MNEKLRSAIYGFAIGDALGVPYEFRTRDTFNCVDMIGNGTHGQPVGTWSDDTSMVLATMNSLTKYNGKLIPQDLMDNFILWRDLGEFTPWGNCFDIGNATNEAIRRARHSDKYWEWGGITEHANGNGSLMRILPFAFLPYAEPVIDVASMITHNTSRCKFACEMYVRICQILIDTGTLDLDDPYLITISNMTRDQIRSTGYVLDSLVAALWCFLTTDDYEEAVLTAVNLGDDTDTIAALTGGLAGILYGYDSIRKDWIEKLTAKDQLDQAIEKFANVIGA